MPVKFINGISEQQIADQLQDAEVFPAENKGDQPNDHHPGCAYHASLQGRGVLGDHEPEIVEGSDAQRSYQYGCQQFPVVIDHRA